MKRQTYIPHWILALLLATQFVPSLAIEPAIEPAIETEASLGSYAPRVMSEEQLKNYPFETIADSYSIRDLSTGQGQVLARWRKNGRHLFARKLGILNINGGKNDLKAMQQLIDRNLIKDHQTELWQSLGVLFGDILVQQFGLHWVSYEDDIGINKVLRFRQTENFIFPITVFSKRIRFGEKINVFDLFAKMEKEVAAFKADELRPKMPL